MPQAWWKGTPDSMIGAVSGCQNIKKVNLTSVNFFWAIFWWTPCIILYYTQTSALVRTNMRKSKFFKMFNVHGVRRIWRFEKGKTKKMNKIKYLTSIDIGITKTNESNKIYRIYRMKMMGPNILPFDIQLKCTNIVFVWPPIWKLKRDEILAFYDYMYTQSLVYFL